MRAALVELSCGSGSMDVSMVVLGVLGLGLGIHLFVLKALLPFNLFT
jgi:hypothetical protein